MNKYFEKFYDSIRITKAQKEEAKRKYDGVCEKLHNYYYTNSNYNGSTKLLIGSYGKKTNIRPARDIDVIFKMPYSSFEQYDSHDSNGQSNLLQKIKSILAEKYPNTQIRTFEKVVVLEFSESNHNVELLPAFELTDRKFIIPNSSNGGFWETWDPRTEITIINNSDTQNSGGTRKLTIMIKKWTEKCSINLKSYKIENAVIKFLDTNNYEFQNIQMMLFDFFEFLKSEVEEKNISYIETASKRAKRAIEYEKTEKILKAIVEWKKIFGDDFPGQKAIKEETLLDEYYSEKEEYIEDYHDVELNDYYFVKINCYVTQDGWRPNLLSKLSFLQKRKRLEFFIESTNVSEPFNVKWKVRNFGDEAKDKNDLRGQIWSDTGKRKKIEHTKYYGKHYVECYIIKDNKCIAYDRVTVPIRN